MHWIASLADFYFRARVLGRPVPLLASFKLTYRCNLACAACPFHQLGKEQGHMSWELAASRLRELAKRGCRLIVFEGGEPLLWQDAGHDINDLLRLAGSLFLRTAVTTNGTLGLDRPADVIWVSIDGLPETHDRLRSGSFSKIRENLQASTHRNILVHHTVNRENRHDLGPLLDLLAGIPQVRGVTMQFFYPYNRGEADLLLSAAERGEVVREALLLKRRGYPILNAAGSLRRMIDNSWSCRESLLINVDPDGAVTQGCYAKSRGQVRCDQCGFTPVAEAAGALDLRPGSLLAGWRTFMKRR